MAFELQIPNARALVVFMCQIQQVSHFSACRLQFILSPHRPATYIMKNARWLGIFALAFITTFNTKECCGQSESLLRVGKAINVFIRYGYLSISMKVISYNDTERWIFKEPTKNVFQVRFCYHLQGFLNFFEFRAFFVSFYE